MIDLKKIGQFFTDRDLWDKSFRQFTEDEILGLAETVFSAPDVSKVPIDGWSKPYLNEEGKLITPFDCHPKYRWWTPAGQSILETLDELGAPEEVKEKYTPAGYGEGMKKQND